MLKNDIQELQTIEHDVGNIGKVAVDKGEP